MLHKNEIMLFYAFCSKSNFYAFFKKNNFRAFLKIEWQHLYTHQINKTFYRFCTIDCLNKCLDEHVCGH